MLDAVGRYLVELTGAVFGEAWQGTTPLWWSKWAKLTGKDDPKEIRRLGELAESKEAPQGNKRQLSIFEVLK